MLLDIIVYGLFIAIPIGILGWAWYEMFKG